ncbi:hypothetical protein LCL95_08725 [Bacillus timonensis]|nr:hypothetical protein [Bacillus timonensis]
MLLLYLTFILFVSLGSSLLLLKRLFTSRKLFSDRFGMVIAMSAPLIFSIHLATHLSFVLPFPFEISVIISTLAMGVIGIMYGALVKLHSVLAGFSSAMIGGFGGVMVGEVIQNPTICGLPQDTLSEITVNMVTFSIFETFILFLSYYFIHFSLKV